MTPSIHSKTPGTPPPPKKKTQISYCKSLHTVAQTLVLWNLMLQICNCCRDDRQLTVRTKASELHSNKCTEGPWPPVNLWTDLKRESAGPEQTIFNGELNKSRNIEPEIAVDHYTYTSTCRPGYCIKQGLSEKHCAHLISVGRSDHSEWQPWEHVSLLLFRGE